jgi:hypothetical protein
MNTDEGMMDFFYMNLFFIDRQWLLQLRRRCCFNSAFYFLGPQTILTLTIQPQSRLAASLLISLLVVRRQQSKAQSHCLVVRYQQSKTQFHCLVVHHLQ